MKIKINDYFKNYYMTCGNTRDNFIFENCPLELIDLAQKGLSINSENKKPCNILITKKIENKLNRTLEKFESELQKKIIARIFFTSLFLRELIKLENKAEQLNFLEKGITSLLSENIENIKEYIINSPHPLDIEKAIKEIGEIELNIFLVDTENKFLQQAVNNYLSSRLPYSVKIFTNNEKLCTYYDQNGNFIQAPHDYINVNVYNYISIDYNNLEK